MLVIKNIKGDASLNYELNDIGYVENCVNEQSDENWGNIKSTIRLNHDYIGGFTGLEDFTHVFVVTYLHEAKFIKEKHLQRRPRNLEEMPLVGIFSQRAKDRPNPIGLTAVKIIEVLIDSLIVEGLDAINGTPVLDVKPYYPQYDRIEEAAVPEWVNNLMKNYF
jgi:tRNA-Thr(GGU) m(6)t(6)A37 methyltransferase TsaA